MTQHEQRQVVIDAINEEAKNGIWQHWHDKNEFILCVNDILIEPETIGRIRGMVQILKGRGDVSVEPYSEGEDCGSYVKLTITPRE